MALQRPLLNEALEKFNSKAEIKKEIATPFCFLFQLYRESVPQTSSEFFRKQGGKVFSWAKAGFCGKAIR